MVGVVFFWKNFFHFDLPPPLLVFFIVIFISMKKIIRLTERDLSRIVKQVVLESEFTKMRRRDGEPILRKMDLVKSVISDISMEMSNEYGLDEYDGVNNIPDYIVPYLDEISEAVSNIDTMPIWDAVYEALDTPEIHNLIGKIVSEYNQNN